MQCALVLCSLLPLSVCALFFFNDTAPTEIYTLSLHDALPIWRRCSTPSWPGPRATCSSRPSARTWCRPRVCLSRDRKSTRLNSSHEWISYAVFCLKKKKKLKSKSKRKGRRDQHERCTH